VAEGLGAGGLAEVIPGGSPQRRLPGQRPGSHQQAGSRHPHRIDSKLAVIIKLLSAPDVLVTQT
jgi:hypothetical protein